MNNAYIYRFICLGVLLLALLSACVTELENPLTLKPQLVINGIFNNSAGQRQIRVLLVEDLEGKGQQVDATGSIYKDGQLSVELIKNAEGDLELPTGYVIEAGAEYFAEIVTDAGQVYRSSPQVVARKLETDEITYEVVEDVEGGRFGGVTLVRSTIEIFAHVEVPSPTIEKQYIRWVMDESWNFQESAQVSDTVCYLYTDVTEYGYALFSNTDEFLQTGDSRVSVAIRPFDNSFHLSHYTNIYLHSLDPKTYEFYAKAKRLTSGTGSIYDEVPGPFRGNVSNAADPEEVVLGWVEFFLADTLRIRTEGEMFRARNIFVPDQCAQTGEPRPCPPQISPPGGGLPPPCQCIDCQVVLGEDALIPPFYWEN